VEYHHGFRSDDGTVVQQTDMDAQVQGTADLLACTWKEFGRNQYVFHPVREDELPAFPNTASGTASFSGKSTGRALVHGETITTTQTVDARGKLRAVALSIPTRDEAMPDAGTCIQLAFDAPMSGKSVLDAASTDGTRKHEETSPDSLGESVYSAFAIRTYETGESEFINHDLTLCDGPRNQPSPIPQELPAGGMTVSADETEWTRSGEWIGHNSMPSEHRYLDFSLKVVPRTLQYPNP
jgi:hypothetical protein